MMVGLGLLSAVGMSASSPLHLRVCPRHTHLRDLLIGFRAPWGGNKKHGGNDKEGRLRFHRRNMKVSVDGTLSQTNKKPSLGQKSVSY